MERWRSINQVAKELNIPETTTRRYFETFRDFLSGQKFGQVIKYPEDSLKVVDVIYRQYKAGKTTEEIRALLKERFNQVIEVTTPPVTQEQSGSVIDLQQLASTQQVFTEMIKRNNELTQQNVEALKTISEVLTRVYDQGEEIQRLKEEIETLREEQKKTSFWNRFFKK